MSKAAEVIGNRIYQVESVEKTAAPAGMEDGSWYSYIIRQGKSTIKGVRNGSLKAVTKHAEEFAHDLNERGVKGYSAYAARSQQKK